MGDLVSTLPGIYPRWIEAHPGLIIEPQVEFGLPMGGFEQAYFLGKEGHQHLILLLFERLADPPPAEASLLEEPLNSPLADELTQGLLVLS